MQLGRKAWVWSFIHVDLNALRTLLSFYDMLALVLWPPEGCVVMAVRVRVMFGYRTWSLQ
jgi:hypothetical protein